MRVNNPWAGHARGVVSLAESVGHPSRLSIKDLRSRTMTHFDAASSSFFHSSLIYFSLVPRNETLF